MAAQLKKEARVAIGEGNLPMLKAALVGWFCLAVYPPPAVSIDNFVLDCA